jgi:hypothetical protein
MKTYKSLESLVSPGPLEGLRALVTSGAQLVPPRTDQSAGARLPTHMNIFCKFLAKGLSALKFFSSMIKENP